MKNLLDLTNPRHKTFLENFKIIRHQDDDKKGYKKNEEFKENDKPWKKKDGKYANGTEKKILSELTIPSNDGKNADTKVMATHGNLTVCHCYSEVIILFQFISERDVS